MIVLTPRLQAVADMVPPGCAVADIGCDHGYVSAYLVQQGIAWWLPMCARAHWVPAADW